MRATSFFYLLTINTLAQYYHYYFFHNNIIVIQTGHGVSPHFRFLAKSGDWIWMQIEATLHCKAGTSIPQFYEYKARVLR